MTKMKKTLAVCLSVALIITSIPPREVEASWFSDFCGFIFTVGTIPIWVLCPNNPTFRKNNPFRKKVWEEEAEEQERVDERIPFYYKTIEGILEQSKKYQTELSSAMETIASLQYENQELKLMVISLSFKLYDCQSALNLMIENYYKQLRLL
jgi:hypothetical protein